MAAQAGAPVSVSLGRSVPAAAFLKHAQLLPGPLQRWLVVRRRYFHAYRIDHILGFFRIWEIPGDCSTGLLGHFRPSLPLWKHELEAKGIWDFKRRVHFGCCFLSI